ncbi:unnamed protein product, partial [Cladocopium goreaui]
TLEELDDKEEEEEPGSKSECGFKAAAYRRFLVSADKFVDVTWFWSFLFPWAFTLPEAASPSLGHRLVFFIAIANLYVPVSKQVSMRVAEYIVPDTKSIGGILN